MFQKLLLLGVIPEPACLPYVPEQIIVRRSAGAGPILGRMEEIANDLIQNHSSLKHSSEVANPSGRFFACRPKIMTKRWKPGPRPNRKAKKNKTTRVPNQT